MQFDIEWIDPCLLDEVTTSTIIEDKIYEIGISESILESPEWT